MSKPKPYLVLHKVRGEPAWDIAEPCAYGDGPGWTIPTSGHRCYPARVYPLDDLVCIGVTVPHYTPAGNPVQESVDVGHLPDHYSVNDKVRKPSVDDVFAALARPSATD